MFIQSDEHIIIMDMGPATAFKDGAAIPANFLLLDELKQLHDIGLKTVSTTGILDWNRFQSSATAKWDYSYLDEYMERCIKAEMKALIPFVDVTPNWKPDDWYLRKDWYGVPNYENEQTGIDYDEFAKLLIDRYDPAHFQLVYATPASGEFPVHFHAYGSRLTIVGTNRILPTPILSKWIIERNKILEAQQGELWTEFHFYNDPVWIDEVYDDLRAEFPTSLFYGIQYTYFNNLKRRPKLVQQLQKARDKWNMKYFIGSEYCTGLRSHTPVAIEHGVWGFITGPLHTFQEHRRLETWMLDELSWSMKQFQEHYG